MSGLDNYYPETNSLGLTRYLLPSDNFMEQYAYLDGDYKYINRNGKTFVELSRYEEVTVLLYLTYEGTIYSQAKGDVMETFALSDTNVYECGEYVFYENITRPIAEGATVENGISSKFPYYFHMAGFNDDACTLVFLGFYLNRENVKHYEKEETLDLGEDGMLIDFEEFVQAYFEWYDFSLQNEEIA